MHNEPVRNVASEQETQTELTLQPRLLSGEELRAVAGGPVIANNYEGEACRPCGA